eukprot:SAG22_NODE_265_length_13348_cov_150.719149_11_plen_167_part_00
MGGVRPRGPAAARTVLLEREQQLELGLVALVPIGRRDLEGRGRGGERVLLEPAAPVRLQPAPAARQGKARQGKAKQRALVRPVAPPHGTGQRNTEERQPWNMGRDRWSLSRKGEDKCSFVRSRPHQARIEPRSEPVQRSPFAVTASAVTPDLCGLEDSQTARKGTV